MNQDIEFPATESVARARQAVQEADGIWIFSPEYNYQIPGVLKNLLDWLSRPIALDTSWESAAAAAVRHRNMPLYVQILIHHHKKLFIGY